MASCASCRIANEIQSHREHDPTADSLMKHWTLDDIPWDRFEVDKVDPRILRVAKAASMVELNGGDYADYLCNVFSGDPAVQRLARGWAQEEVQHGRAL